MRSRVKKAGTKDPKVSVEDLQIFLQYVKSALRCVVDECSTIENVKETIEELITEIDDHVKASGDNTFDITKKSTKKSSSTKDEPGKAKSTDVQSRMKMHNDDVGDNPNDTTEYDAYFDLVNNFTAVSDDAMGFQRSSREDHMNIVKDGVKIEKPEEVDDLGMRSDSDAGLDESTPAMHQACHEDFENPNLLEENDNESIAFNCLICNMEFTKKRNLLMHIVKKNHVVSMDGSVDDIATGLNNDDLEDFRAKLHTCPDCGKQFTKPSLLNVHRMVHGYDSKDKPKKHVCNVCNTTFNQAVSLTIHLVKVHGADIDIPSGSRQLKAMLLTCEYCGKKFRLASNLLLHRRTHTNDKQYKCKQCRKDFIDEDALKSHLATSGHTSKKDQSDVESCRCELCGKAFTKKTEYYEHFNSHKNEWGFKCPGCERYFSRKENLKWHMATSKHSLEGFGESSTTYLSTTLQGMKIYSCEYCGKKFNKPSSLRLHLSKHTGERPYKCEHCERAFTRNYHLTEHVAKFHADKDKPVVKVKGPYMCRKCNKYYSTPVSLRAHIARHDGMKYKCNDCGKLFMRKESLQMHVVREGHSIGEGHSIVKDLTEFSKKLIPCNICGKKLLRPSLLIKHMKSHTGGAPAHFCVKCLEVFETNEEKQAHSCSAKQKRSTKSERRSSAGQDDNSETAQDDISGIVEDEDAGSESNDDESQSLEDTYKHMSVDELESLLKMTGEAAEFLNEHTAKQANEEHEETEQTEETAGTSKEATRSAQRMKAYFINKALRMKSEKGRFKKDGKTYYKCSYCPKYFARRGVTQNHERRHTGSKPFSCPTCGRAFSMIQTLKNHLLTHAEEKPYQCTICNKGFVQKSSQMRHMFMHSGKVLPFKCDVCNKAFYREGELKKHMEKHDDTLPKDSHICEQCGKSFCTKQGLKNHAMLHAPVRKYYSCEVCNRQFTMAVRLKKHMLVHSDERPFICNYCGKGFARSHYLTNHIRVHTGEKRFKCTYCFKGFTTSGQLAIHTRSHTGEKPYACSICGKRSTDSANHIKHMRTHQYKVTGSTGNSKHRSTSNTNTVATNNAVPQDTNTQTNTNSNSNNPHLHVNQTVERPSMTALHQENLMSMKNMRPVEPDNLLQPIHNALRLPHNALPPDAHSQPRLSRPGNFFNPMPGSHMPMPNSAYPDGSQFNVFRYNDRM